MASRDHTSFYIGGKWLPAQSDAVFDVVSPRSQERIGSVPAASSADIDAAVTAARHAFDETDWSRRPPAERGELCARLATAIAGRSGELAELFTEETGSPIMLSRVNQAVAPSGGEGCLGGHAVAGLGPGPARHRHRPAYRRGAAGEIAGRGGAGQAPPAPPRRGPRRISGNGGFRGARWPCGEPRPGRRRSAWRAPPRTVRPVRSPVRPRRRRAPGSRGRSPRWPSPGRRP